MHSSPASAAQRQELPVEVVSDEEMALIDAALAAAAAVGARPLLSSAARRAAAPLSCAAYSAGGGDIEDSPLPRRSLLARFRENRALAVTDITATEWCEKQMEFVLEHGKPKRTEAMKAGSDRHAQLEQEVVERVDVTIKSAEESWAVKFMNFIMGINQLMFEGITCSRASHGKFQIGVVEGSWMVGIIDEIRMPMDGISLQPILLDTKTRVRPTVPSEAQKRNGRLQLMCYKYLWDSLIAERFPAENFFGYFGLDPNYLLSDEIKQYISTLGFDAKTFEDVLKYYMVTCHTLPQSQELLFLRYELQADHSLLEEYQFTYDAKWFKDQIQEALGFWQGSREPKFVTEEDMWKCSFCKFASKCPMIASTSRC